MSRNFGIMSGPASLRGVSTDRPASIGSYAPSNLYSLPSQSILHREDIPDAPFNLRAWLFIGAFAGAIAAFLVGSFYVVSFLFDA